MADHITTSTITAQSCCSCLRPLSRLRDGHARLKPCHCAMCPKCLLEAYASALGNSSSLVCPRCDIEAISHEFVEVDTGSDNFAAVGGYCSDSGVKRPPKRARVENESEDSKEVVKKKKHHYKRFCRVEGCTSRAKAGGVCKRHKSRRLVSCSREGCNFFASEMGGLCAKHLSGREDCNVEGCDNLSQDDGRCLKHGGKKAWKVRSCEVEGCTSQGRKKGLCRLHYNQKFPPDKVTCGHEGCEDPAIMKGYCKGHYWKRKRGVDGWMPLEIAERNYGGIWC